MHKYSITSQNLLWVSEAAAVTKQRLEARKKLNLPNDWKIAFYKKKLSRSQRLIKKLLKKK